MINYKENYNKWLEDNFFDEETREELSNLIDEKEIEDIQNNVIYKINKNN